MKTLFACILLVASTSVGAQAPDRVVDAAADLRDRALADNRAYATLSSLLTEVGPRFAGTAGDQAAVAWALRTLRDAGLTNVRAETVEVPRWVRGEITVDITAPYPQSLVAVALGGSIGTPDDGIEAPVVMVSDVDELRTLSGSDVAGKVVFFNRRMERLRDGSDYGRTVRNRGEGPAVAAGMGAVGVVIRSVGTSTTRVAHTGSMRYQGAIAPIPAAALAHADADTLARQVETGRQVTLRMHVSSRDLPPTRSANVIGEIPGRGPRANEIILLGAHLDSWDTTPGAHDDGAGVVIVSEAARLIAARRNDPPRRTIRVVLYANEEFGLSGARAYAAAHADEMDRHVLGLGADSGSTGAWRFDSGVAESALPAVEQMQQLLEPLGIEAGPNSARGIADFVPLREYHVPMLDIRQDMALYFDLHHTANDTLDTVDPAELSRNVAAYAALLYFAAYGDVDFGRRPDPATED